jgi:hypothetical protein
MDRREDNRWVVAGAMGAAVLGVALIPLRDLTPAGNLAFPFLLLTIVMAELGGGMAVVATAVTSALSLDFFLTRPYFSFAIAEKHDALAFLGLAVCGLTVAGFRSWRARRRGPGEQALHLDLLRTIIERAGEGEPIATTLEHLRRELPLAAVEVRDVEDRLLAGDGDASGIPEAAFEPEIYHSVDERGPLEVGLPIPFPTAGARLPLHFRDRRVGWLDVWGNGAPASPDARRTLVDAARVLAIALSR